MSIIMSTNTVKVYYNLALILYIKGLVLKAVNVFHGWAGQMGELVTSKYTKK